MPKVDQDPFVHTSIRLKRSELALLKRAAKPAPHDEGRSGPKRYLSSWARRVLLEAAKGK